jgi:tetratricopeptide (TPR) repeat protein
VPPIEIRLKKAVDPGPSPEIMAALKDADAAFEAGKFPEARQKYEQALADPKVAAQPEAVKALHIRIARALSQEGQYKQELEHLKAVIALDPANVDIVGLAAQEAIKGGLVDEGMALLSKLDAAQVKDPAVFFNVGVLLLNQNKQGEAIPFFTKSVEADPAFVDGYLQRALAHYGQGKTAEAKADFQKVLEIAPGTPQAETAKQAMAGIK